MNEEISATAIDGPKRGMTLDTLKFIAIIAMALDHSAHAFVPEGTALYIIMRFIGRITGPVMFFAAAEGYRHTRSINRYMLRLAVFAFLSYVPFMLFKAGGVPAAMNIADMSVISTLFLGVAAIRVRHEIKNPVAKVLLIACLVLLSIPADWGGIGIVLMLIFDYFYGNFRFQAFGYCIAVLLYTGLLDLVTRPFYALLYGASVTFSLQTYQYDIIGLGMFVPILLLSFYNGRKGSGGRFHKWFFYWFYPLHLLLLGVLQRFF